MDPDEARRRLNELLTQMQPDDMLRVSTMLDEASELWRALDSWLSGGGFLPSQWER